MAHDRKAAISAEVRDAAMRAEPDRYLAATLAPPACRPALAAIAAFAAELARFPATVSEPMLGDIRLQWWRDALEQGRAGIRSGHPIADALVDAARHHGLPPDLLAAMIDARELDLAGGLPHDDAGLAVYLEATSGHPFRLALRVLGADDDRINDLASAAGLAYGIARALGRLPMLLHNGGFPLPADRLRAAGLDPQRLSESPPSPAAVQAAAAVAGALSDRARAALDVVRSRWHTVPRHWRPSLLPLAMVKPYLRAQSDRALLLEMADVSPLERVVRIGLAHLTGRL